MLGGVALHNKDDKWIERPVFQLALLLAVMIANNFHQLQGFSRKYLSKPNLGYKFKKTLSEIQFFTTVE